jgi:hypothetical protein
VRVAIVLDILQITLLRQKLMLDTWCENSQQRPKFETCQAIIRDVINDIRQMVSELI